MARNVAIVTDSTSYLPSQWVQEFGIIEVPVQVVVGGKAYNEGIEISTAEVAQALREWQPVSTSRPSPVEFSKAYQKAADLGAEHIVSVHLSSELSGTFQTAILAAKDSPIPVTPVDSRTLAMALGFACIAGARAADAGKESSEVAEVARRCAARSQTFFYVDNLEYLRRGGRMGKTSAAVGTALRVKPILTVRDGRVELLEKSRTSGKALARLSELAIETARGRQVDIAVQHIDASQRADDVIATLRTALPSTQVIKTEIGAVVGAHVGPGMVSVAIAERSE